MPCAALPVTRKTERGPLCCCAAGKVTVRTTPESGFLLSAEQLRAALTPKTRLLVICNPSNPTGACVVHTPPRWVLHHCPTATQASAPTLVVLLV